MPTRDDKLEADLLEAVYGAPDDDGPRLVYADWLMEHHDPRGELIAMQCAGQASERARALAARHARTWLGPLAPAIVDPRECIFDRGFVLTARVRDHADVDSVARHPAWATLRRVTVPRNAKRTRPHLLAHLSALNVEIHTDGGAATTEQTLTDLKACARGDDNYLWCGFRALGRLVPGLDLDLVERAMRVVFPLGIERPGRTLPDEYVPVALQVLASIRTPEAMFLANFAASDDGVRMRDGSAWLHELSMVHVEENIDPLRTVQSGSKQGKRLAQLRSSEPGMAAARATVQLFGTDAPRLLAIVAHEGSDVSRVAVAATVETAASSRGGTLDVVNEWFLPFAKSAEMAALARAVRAATTERGATSDLLPLLSRFGARGDRLALDVRIGSKQVYSGRTRRVTAWIQLDSHRSPRACANVMREQRTMSATLWEDGKLTRDDLELGAPASVEDLPRWLAGCAKKLEIDWDRKTVLVTSSLRGKCRAAAIDWLFPAHAKPSSPGTEARAPRTAERRVKDRS